MIASSETEIRNHNQLEALMASIKALNLIIKTQQTDSYVGTQLKKIQSVIAQVRESNRLEGHTKSVWDVSFNNDGSKIASASEDKNIKLWSVKGELLDTLKGHQKGVWSVKFSRNGRLIASTSLDDTVKIWKIQGNKGIISKTFFGHTNDVLDVSFSPDDKILASSSSDGTIKLWHTEGKDNKEIKTLNAKEILIKEGYEVEKYRIYSLDFHPNNNSEIAYSGNDGNVRIWNWKTTSNPEFVGTHGKKVVGIVKFSRKKNILASASYDGLIKLWTKKDGKWKLIWKIQAHEKNIYGLAFSPNGEILASGSSDETVKLWQVDEAVNQLNTKQFLTPQIFKGHKELVNRLEFSPNGQFIASSSNDKTVRLWSRQVDFTANNNPQPEKLLRYSCELLKNYLQTSKNLPNWFNNSSGECPVSVKP